MSSTNPLSSSGAQRSFIDKIKERCPGLNGKLLAQIAAVALTVIATIVSFIFLPWQVGLGIGILALGLTIWTIVDCAKCGRANRVGGQRPRLTFPVVADPWYTPLQSRAVSGWSRDMHRSDRRYCTERPQYDEFFQGPRVPVGGDAFSSNHGQPMGRRDPGFMYREVAPPPGTASTGYPSHLRETDRRVPVGLEGNAQSSNPMMRRHSFPREVSFPPSAETDSRVPVGVGDRRGVSTISTSSSVPRPSIAHPTVSPAPSRVPPPSAETDSRVPVGIGDRRGVSTIRTLPPPVSRPAVTLPTVSFAPSRVSPSSTGATSGVRSGAGSENGQRIRVGNK